MKEILAYLSYFKEYSDFRFVKLGMWNTERAKAPIERRWKNINNYTWYDGRLVNHVAEGYNYGIATGYGGLTVIDADVPFITKTARDGLPETLEIETGRHGVHQYYLCNMEKSIRLIDKKEGEKVQHIGEVQSHGKLVVGPGSRHPNGNYYRILKDMKIAEVTEAKIREVFNPWIRKMKKGCSTKVNLGDFKNLNVGNIVDSEHMKEVWNGDRQGAHPVHGSSGGNNFTVNPLKNVWYCFRHDTGGGPLLLIAVVEGIIDCGEAHNGILTGDVLEQTIKIARQKYGVTV